MWHLYRSAWAFKKTIVAPDVVVGDFIPVLLADASAPLGWKYEVAAVTGVSTVTKDGMLLPALESPFLVVDGTVSPTGVFGSSSTAMFLGVLLTKAYGA